MARRPVIASGFRRRQVRRPSPSAGTPRARVLRSGGAGLLMAVTLGIAGACDGGPETTDDTSGPPMARDSAGLQVLEYQEPLHPSFWTVETEPALELGLAEVRGVPPFHRIRGAVVPLTARGEAAGVVVADGGSRELRYFSMDGDLVTVLGGPGEGPGEFRTLDGILLAAPDTVLAFDAGLQRISRFHVEEGVLGSFRLEGIPADASGEGRTLGGAARLLGRAGDGSLFIEPLEMIREPVEGLWREEWLVVRLDHEGTSPSIVGRFFQAERFVAREGPQTSVIARPFSRRGDFQAAGTELLYSDGSFAGYVRHSLDGQPLGVVRTSHQPRPVTAGDRDRWRDERIGEDLDTRQTRQRLFLQAVTEVPFPDTHPAVDRMLPDPCGFVWLRTAPSPDREGENQEWLVFRLEDHRWMGRVMIPRDQQPVHIAVQHLVSISTTDLAEEFVRINRIDRDSARCDARSLSEP